MAAFPEQVLPCVTRVNATPLLLAFDRGRREQLPRLGFQSEPQRHVKRGGAAQEAVRLPVGTVRQQSANDKRVLRIHNVPDVQAGHRILMQQTQVLM